MHEVACALAALFGHAFDRCAHLLFEVREATFNEKELLRHAREGGALGRLGDAGRHAAIRTGFPCKG